MESKRVVVTGLGAITPIGKTLPEYWEGLVNGRNGAGEITRFDSTLYKTHFACEVKDYNPEDYFEKKNVRKYDHFAQFGLIAADEAIADSGISAENCDLDEVGVMMTSGIGGVNHLYHETMEVVSSPSNTAFVVPITPRCRPAPLRRTLSSKPSTKSALASASPWWLEVAERPSANSASVASMP